MNTTARNKATYLRNRGPLIWCQLAASRKRSNMPFFLSIIRSPRIRRPDEARLWRRFLRVGRAGYWDDSCEPPGEPLSISPLASNATVTTAAEQPAARRDA